MKRSSPGYILLEALTALALLGILLAGMVPVLALAARVHAENARTHLALQEAANLTERVRRVPFEELTQPLLATWRLSPAASRTLPGGSLELVLQPPADGVASKRVTIHVRWQGPAGRAPAVLRLDAWRHDVGDASP